LMSMTEKSKQLPSLWFRGGDKCKQQQESLYDDTEWSTFSKTAFWKYCERLKKSIFFSRERSSRLFMSWSILLSISMSHHLTRLRVVQPVNSHRPAEHIH
jgi:hypothetical protein